MNINQPVSYNLNRKKNLDGNRGSCLYWLAQSRLVGLVGNDSGITLPS